MHQQPRIYISCPYDPRRRFLDHARQSLREGILQCVREQGFEPQEFGVSGLPQGSDWDFARARDVMLQCDGALVIAIARWFTEEGGIPVPVPSEYSHFEGALAIGARIPLLVISEETMVPKGILAQGGASVVIKVDVGDYANWLASGVVTAEPVFKRWVATVNARRDVFMGYCSKASELAATVKSALTDEALSVMDWATDFVPGRTIMQEVARAAQLCRTGLFLFTADDPINSESTPTIVPRDNVLLEAGYFASSKSLSRVLIVREKGVNMPADLGGIIYHTFDSKDQWPTAVRAAAHSIRRMIQADAAA